MQLNEYRVRGFGPLPGNYNLYSNEAKNKKKGEIK
jgi:hypothetical protein